MSNKKCFLCDKLADNPKQCTECEKCFCYKCLITSYKEEKKCPSCSFSLRLDQYYPVYDSVVNETSSINVDNRRYFCVECLKNFNEKEIQEHINHHTYNYNILEQVEITGILKNINKIIGFKNELETNYIQCRNDSELLNSIKKIKLDEIDNIKTTVELFYQNKYESLKENENELDRLLSTYKDYINKSFDKISKIINNFNPNNNLNDVLNKGNVKIKKYLNDMEEDKKKLENIIKQGHNSLNYFCNFKSYNGQKIEINQFKWNKNASNNTINLSLESNPKWKVYIYQNENDRMRIRVDFKEKNNSQYKKFFTYLGIFNREKNKTLVIPIKFCFYNKNDEINIFESNFENINEFEQLIGDSMELKLYVSELEIGNNEM